MKKQYRSSRTKNKKNYKKTFFFIVYFQCVNERAAHVKIDCVSRWCRPGP